MDTTPVTAQPRTRFGKGAARKLRAAGQVPAVIYRDGDAPTHITVDPQELTLLFRRLGNPNALLSMSVGGQDFSVLVKASEKHPITRALYHIDFYEVRADRYVVVEVPLRKTGRSEGEKLGGRIRFLRRTVKIRCLPADIPAQIEYDVSDLTIGEFVRASNVAPPSGCQVVYDTDYNLLKLQGKRTAIAAAAEDEEGEGEEAEA